MEVLVHKYGGTSLATIDHIHRAARRVAAAHTRGKALVVVVSARGDSTDELLRLAADVSPVRPAREVDALLAVGECQSAALMALALHGLGVPAVSLTGPQAGIHGTDRHGNALIATIDAGRLMSVLRSGSVAAVAGFQAATARGDVATLGRGGSDTTAVALAAGLGAARCEIYTDVDGVFTADPRTVPAARRLEYVDAAVMAEMAFAGAGVLHPRCVELAAMEGIELHVRNASSPSPGTVVSGRLDGKVLETRGVVIAVTHDLDVARVLVHCRGGRDLAPDLLQVLADEGVAVDLVARSGPYEDEFRMGFTIRRSQLGQVCPALHATATSLGGGVHIDENVGKVSVVGMGLLNRPEYTAALLTALATAGIPTSWISTSQLRTSVTVPVERTVEAVAALHRRFGLDRPQPALAASAESVPAGL